MGLRKFYRKMAGVTQVVDPVTGRWRQLKSYVTPLPPLPAEAEKQPAGLPEPPREAAGY